MTTRTPGQVVSILLTTRVQHTNPVRFDQLEWRVSEGRREDEKEPERPRPSNAVMVYTCSVHRRDGSRGRSEDH